MSDYFVEGIHTQYDIESNMDLVQVSIRNSIKRKLYTFKVPTKCSISLFKIRMNEALDSLHMDTIKENKL